MAIKPPVATRPTKPTTMHNPPPVERLRLVVRARKELPKKFIWLVIKEDRDGQVTLSQSTPEAFDTMETAYDHGKPVLMALRARESRTQAMEQ